MSQWPNYSTIPNWANTSLATSAPGANLQGIVFSDAGFKNANTGEILVAIRQLAARNDLENVPQISTRTVTNANYVTGNTLNVSLLFNEPVEVVIPDAANSTPKIKLQFQTPAGAAGNVYAWYVSGSNSNTLLFTHVVAANAQTFFTLIPDYNPMIVCNGSFILDTAYVRGHSNTNANLIFTTANLTSVRVNP